VPILPKDRDPRLITIRRGGTLTDEDHRLLTEWAVQCAEHVLPFFEAERPGDERLRHALEMGRGWIRGEVSMMDSRAAAFESNAAARGLADPAKFAALSTGQASAVPHVAAHDLGAAAYAIRAAQAAAPPAESEAVRLRERDWQRERIPAGLHQLVLGDQQARNAICWHVFDD
jgi:hypothetical protein